MGARRHLLYRRASRDSNHPSAAGAKLQPALFPPPDRPRDATALLACAHGEQHTLGLSMVGDVLRSKGWRVFEMGADVSADMVAVALAHRAPELVGFSATMSWSIPP
ncbi:MAG: cobalamin B12-binding domain-containing protein [Thermoleophilaceae bacterium]